MIKKGTKFTMKSLQGLDYTTLSPAGWTTDDGKNDLIKRTLNNYNIKANDALGQMKRKKFAITVGDELPSGIVQLAKVYLANKRKLKVGDKMAGRHGNKGIVAIVLLEQKICLSLKMELQLISC